SGINSYPLTDGTNVIYRKSGSPYYKIILVDTAGTLVPLDALRTSEATPHWDYAVAGGYAAFTRSTSGGPLQVYRRDLTGSNAALTSFASVTRIETLSSTGEVMVMNSENRYLSKSPTSSPVLVS